MLAPNNMKAAIAKAFYDKTFAVFREISTLGDDGGAETTYQPVGSFKGNVQFGFNAKMVFDLGVEFDADLNITTDRDHDIKKGDKITYAGEDFRVKEVRKRDTHQLIIGKRMR